MEVSAKYSNYQDTEWEYSEKKWLLAGLITLKGKKKLFYFFLRVQWIFQEQIWTNPLFFCLLILIHHYVCVKKKNWLFGKNRNVDQPISLYTEDETLPIHACANFKCMMLIR